MPIIWLKNMGGGLTIIWPMEEACRIPFYDVFAEDMFDDIEFDIIEIDEYYHKYGGIKDNFNKKKHKNAFRSIVQRLKIYIGSFPLCIIQKKFKLEKKYAEYNPPKKIGWSGASYLDYTKNVWQKLKEMLKISSDVFIHAYCGIIQDKEKEIVDFATVRFKKEYWDTVETIMYGKNNWIGVHIRRTDHAAAIKESRTEDFIKYMKEISKLKDDVTFFLATDDILEENILKKEFGCQIVTQKNKEWGRTTKGGMKSGIIDCLCLSSCEYIIGSYTSVFSFFSARYGKKDLIICKKDC